MQKSIFPIFTFLFIISFVMNPHCQPTFQKYIASGDSAVFLNSIERIDNSLLVLAWIVEDYFPSGLSMINLNEKGEVNWSKAYNFDYFSPFHGHSFISSDGHLILLMYVAIYSGPYTLEGQKNTQVLVKFTKTGEVVWDYRLEPSSTSLAIPIDIRETADGNYLLITVDGLFKLAQDGEKLWEKKLTFGSDYKLHRILTLADHTALIVGTKTNTELFTGEQHSTILSKVDNNGVIQWSKAIKGIRPWQLELLPNGDFLLTGHSLSAFQQAKFIRLSPSADIVWAKNIPIKNNFKMDNLAILEDGTILTYLNMREGTILVKLDSDGAVLWGKHYAVNDNQTPFIDEWGKLLISTNDGGFAMLNKRWRIDEKDLLIKTDALGQIDGCYSASICVPSEAFTLPPTIEVEVNIQEINNSGIRLEAIGGTVHSIQTNVKSHCPKIPVPSPYFTLADTFCINTPLQLDSLCQAEAELWRWQAQGRTLSNEANPQDLQFETAGQYTLSHIIKTNGCLDTFSRVVEIVDAPVFDIGQDTVLCEDTPFVWNIEQGKLQNYTWSDSVIGAQRSISASEYYTAFAEDDYCQVQASRRIDFIDDLFPESPINLGVDTSICQQIPYVLDVTHPQASNYLWSDGSTNSVRTIREAGTYSLTATVATCPFEDEIVVQTEDCAGKVYIPTAFSPNGDGLNDFFEIATKNATLQEVQIFNRWGNLVYAGTQAWDGGIDGKQATTGLYVCKIVYEETLLQQQKEVINELILIR